MYQTDTEFPGAGCWGAGVPPAAAGQHQAVLDWPNSRRELDPGMHGSEPKSGLPAGQGAGSSSAAGHGQRAQDPRDPPALQWVWRARRGIPSWSTWGPLSCPTLPVSVALYSSSLVGPKRSVGGLSCYIDHYKQGPFSAFLSYRYLSVTINMRYYQLWSRRSL